MNFSKTTIKGFTLVELIIVVTILAILATVAFVSFQGFTKDARDSNRLASLTSIENGLAVYYAKNQAYPDFDDGVEIQGSGGVIIGYQGYVGDNVSRLIYSQDIPKDPLDGSKYVYSTNASKNKYQLMAFMEGDEHKNLAFLGVGQALADFSARNPKTQGNALGIVLDANNNPINQSINISSHSGSNLNIFFGGGDKVSSNSGAEIFSKIYNRRSDLISNKDLAAMDKNLVAYWDMETTKNAAGYIVLKDFSSNSNDLICHNQGTLINCGDEPGPNFVGGQKGGAMEFKNPGGALDGLTLQGYVISNGSHFIDFSKGYTMVALIKENPQGVSSIFNNGAYRFHISNGTLLIRSDLFSGALNSEGGGCGGSSPTLCVNDVKDWKIGFNNNSSSFKLLTATFDNNLFRLYLGPNMVYSVKGGLRDNPSNFPTIFGLSHDNSWGFDGIIDEVRIYNRTLSDAEVRELYLSTK